MKLQIENKHLLKDIQSSKKDYNGLKTNLNNALKQLDTIKESLKSNDEVINIKSKILRTKNDQMSRFKDDEAQLNVLLEKLEKSNLKDEHDSNIDSTLDTATKEKSLLEVEDYINLTCEIHKIKQEIKSWERKIQLLILNK